MIYTPWNSCIRPRFARAHARRLPDCAEAMGLEARPATCAIIGDYDPDRKNAARSMDAGRTEVTRSLAAVTITEPLRVRGVEMEDLSPSAIPSAPDRYAVVGNPIAHSRSPFIHRRFAAETGERVEYHALLVEPGGFRAAVERFRAGGGCGLNVTLPFKEEAFVLSDRRSGRAERAGAVNTLWFDGGAVCGDNTDGVGLVRDLTRNLAVGVERRSVLLLGAGGAARGAVGPLLDEGPERLVVANRTMGRAVELARRFEGQGPVSAAALDALPAGGFDVVVNATAASLAGGLPHLPRGVLRAGGVAYDMAYAARPTPFVEWGAGEGAAVAADGLGMLVEQAAEAFRIWRGREPRTPPVIEALRARLAEVARE